MLQELAISVYALHAGVKVRDTFIVSLFPKSVACDRKHYLIKKMYVTTLAHTRFAVYFLMVWHLHKPRNAKIKPALRKKHGNLRRPTYVQMLVARLYHYVIIHDTTKVEYVTVNNNQLR
jgi:hypothetical protein